MAVLSSVTAQTLEECVSNWASRDKKLDFTVAKAGRRDTPPDPQVLQAVRSVPAECALLCCGRSVLAPRA